MIAYIVDTSVLIQGFIADDDTLRVYTILAALSDSTPVTLHVPEFSLVECANVLWKQAHFGGTSPQQVKNSLYDLLTLPLTIHISSILVPRALEIALASGLAVYDCVHIALAESLKLPLITVDNKQSQTANKLGILLKPITDFAESTK